MNIRNMHSGDFPQVLDMMRVFYASPAVLNKASDEILTQDINDCIGECPFVEGYVFCDGEEILGYSMLAKSYSTEYGGLCVWIEDIYIKPQYRSMGIGSKFFSFIDELYRGKAVRMRLEAEEENFAAVRLYERCGYSRLPYIQMTKENI